MTGRGDLLRWHIGILFGDQAAPASGVPAPAAGLAGSPPAEARSIAFSTEKQHESNLNYFFYIFEV